MIFLAKGHCYLGHTTRDKDGNIVEKSEARFETDPEGSSVVVGILDDDTLEPTAPTEVFGDFDPWGYLSHALKLLAPKRPGNIPDFESIFKKEYQDHGNTECPALIYCDRSNCDDCIVYEWMEEVDEGEDR